MPEISKSSNLSSLPSSRVFQVDQLWRVVQPPVNPNDALYVGIEEYHSASKSRFVFPPFCSMSILIGVSKNMPNLGVGTPGILVMARYGRG